MSILDYIFKSQAQKVAEAEAFSRMNDAAIKRRTAEMTKKFMEAERACGKCMFYDDAPQFFGASGFDGYCKRHPSTETKRALDWCGEYVVDVAFKPLPPDGKSQQ
jgi:hypothetical protein